MNADFSDRTYTVEVMKTVADANQAVNTILQLTRSPKSENKATDEFGREVTIHHAFIESEHQFSRTTRTITLPNGERVDVPRTIMIRGKGKFLYDVFVVQCANHVVVAVPFHRLAEDFFVRIDRALVGSRTVYERLDITGMVVRLGSIGYTSLRGQDPSKTMSLSVTRCHLAYAERDKSNGDIKQVHMTGQNLGASAEYQMLIKAVLDVNKSSVTVTPIILGFALSTSGVKKASATTDRHGNFKLWIAPGLRQLIRVFTLLSAIEGIENVSSTTSNVPILQSKHIRDTEE